MKDLNHDCVLNTDDKSTNNILKGRITVVNQKPDYTDKHNRLKWFNTFIGNRQTTKDWKEHVEKNQQVSTFLIMYARKVNYSVTGIRL